MIIPHLNLSIVIHTVNDLNNQINHLRSLHMKHRRLQGILGLLLNRAGAGEESAGGRISAL